MEIWGSGKVRREFLLLMTLRKYCKVHEFKYKKNQKFSDVMCSHINVGAGKVAIEELAHRISKIISYDGELFSKISRWSSTKIIGC